MFEFLKKIGHLIVENSSGGKLVEELRRLGDNLQIILPTIMIYEFLYEGTILQAGFWSFGLILAELEAEILKRLIPQTRPNGLGTRSIISGHTVASTFATVALGLKRARETNPQLTFGEAVKEASKTVIPMAVGTVTVGVSRIVSDRHYPSNVLYGAALGAGNAIAGHYLHKLLFPRSTLLALPAPENRDPEREPALAIENEVTTNLVAREEDTTASLAIEDGATAHLHTP